MNPFQLATIEAENGGVYDPVYFQVGDWHDTLRLGTILNLGANLRFWVDRFTGYGVIHCHKLDHSDVGMMALFLITGVEGATYPNATSIDPTCYSGLEGRGYIGGA